jgi:outer membrane protein OmpA-like peptidoglycan-associated protein
MFQIYGLLSSCIKYSLIPLLILWQCTLSAQTKIKSHPFSGTIVLSLEGGITIAKTDYKNDRFGLRGLASVEYFLPTSVISVFGVRAYGGGQTVSGEDSRRIPTVIETDMYLLGGGLVYAVSIEDKFFPYIFTGISNLWFNPKDESGERAPNNSAGLYDKTSLSYDGEIGAKIPLTDALSLGICLSFHFLETDFFDDISQGEKDFYAASSVSLSYSLLTKNDDDGDGVNNVSDVCPETPSNVEVDEFGCPLDSDNDGVPDYVDKCPDTREGIRTNTSGCPVDSDFDGITDDIDQCPDTPLGSIVNEEGCLMDSDQDGISDNLDQCPDSEPGIAVDEFGCALIDTSKTIFSTDSDTDGIVDSLDKCPDTPPGLMIDESGCASIFYPNEPAADSDTIRIISDLVFKDDTDEINPGSRLSLNKLVSFFQKDPFTKWKIVGNMDNTASPQVIQELSLKRAAAILNYFINRELPSFQFRIESAGASNPISGNNTLEGRVLNRRVDIIRIK